MTVRQVYYQLVSQGVIDKTEAEYKQTTCRLLVQMRKDHLIPFHWIADGRRRPRAYEWDSARGHGSSHGAPGLLTQASRARHRRSTHG